jgi:hypothetical protein
MRACPECGGAVEASHRFCPWCGTVQRLKLVEFFAGHEALDPDRALRVSRYVDGGEAGPHVRVSIWQHTGGGAQAEAALSLDEAEAARLSGFLGRPRPRRRRLLERLSSRVR